MEGLSQRKLLHNRRIKYLHSSSIQCFGAPSLFTGGGGSHFGWHHNSTLLCFLLGCKLILMFFTVYEKMPVLIRWTKSPSLVNEPVNGNRIWTWGHKAVLILYSILPFRLTKTWSNMWHIFVCLTMTVHRHEIDNFFYIFLGRKWKRWITRCSGMRKKY